MDTDVTGNTVCVSSKWTSAKVVDKPGQLFMYPKCHFGYSVSLEGMQESVHLWNFQKFNFSIQLKWSREICSLKNPHRVNNLYKLHSLVFTVFTIFGSAGVGAVLW